MSRRQSHHLGFLALAAFVGACLVAPSSAFAGNLFASADTNIIDPLLGVTNGSPLDAGNQRFFINLLAGGSKVVILDTSVNSMTDEAEVARDFYNGLGGVSATLITGTLSAAQLAGASLFIAPAPDETFTPAEIGVMKSFLGIGGNILLTGDNNDPAFSVTNAAVNSALLSLGSMSLIPDSFDAGVNHATIASDPFTFGVASFLYAAPSQISGGVGLFSGSAGRVFLASQRVAFVPEPSTAALLVIGCVAALVARRR
jgi:hypothetical protein